MIVFILNLLWKMYNQDPVAPGYFMFSIVAIMCVIVIVDAIKDSIKDGKKNKNKS